MPAAAQMSVHAGRGEPSRRVCRAAVGVVCLAAVALGCEAAGADSGFVRVICRGLHELSMTEASVRCSEASVLPANDGRIVPGSTTAEANRAAGAVAVSASGGSVRDLGYNGGQSEGLIKQVLIVPPGRSRTVPVRVELTVDYAFSGMGEGRLGALLMAAADSGGPGNHNQGAVRIGLVHHGFRGAEVIDVQAQGPHLAPALGRLPRSGTLVMHLDHDVAPDSSAYTFRAELKAYALPNLDSLSAQVHAAVSATGRIRVLRPCAQASAEARPSMQLWPAPQRATESDWASEDGLTLGEYDCAGT